MESRSDWNIYHERTEGAPPRQLLQRAVPYVGHKGNALDLGAGALNDSKYLLEEGFEHVTAVDIEPGVQKYAEEIKDERFDCVISSFENFHFEPEKYDLVSAQFALPFTPEESFGKVLENIKSSLKVGGIFTGQLWGDENQKLPGEPEQLLLTRQQAEDLFKDMQVIDFYEYKGQGHKASGTEKHFHTFYIIAQKK